MKNSLLFGLLLFIVTINAIAQAKPAQVFYINRLPQQDTLLGSWRMQPGDNPQFANPTFDDSKWAFFDPAIDIENFTALRKAGICWLRLHIKVDTSSAAHQLAAWVFQYSASEIYLDGRLLKKYGVIDKNTSATIAYCPAGDLFDLPLKPGIEQVISVRLAYQSGLPYCSPYFTPLSAFSMYVNDFSTAFKNAQQNSYVTNKAVILCGVFTGMAFITSVIYLFYFLFNRKEKVHLYYSISTAFFTLLFLAFTFFVNNIVLVPVQTWAAYSIAIGFVTSSLFMLLTVYTLFRYAQRSIFKVLVFVGIASLMNILFSDIAGFIFATNLFMGICTLEGIRVSVWAIRHHKKGASAILIGLVVSILLNGFSAVLDQTDFLSMVMACLSIVVFPLGMSVYLAIQHAITNQVLRSTLNEVQTLSAQNMLKEQEKQQILSNQNELLEQQVTDRTAALKQSLHDLTSTQKQLIQSEKMAGLGELTAGIAHEIQNPLNFVNNFSEINTELIDELQQEADKGNISEVKAIAKDIRENEEKINHHGKHADSIVKGMLQHSRSSSGQKEPTDINALADEYLRLAYHGLRAKDKTFNATLKTDYDESIGNINVVPQDMGRVILNLITNAFYAVNEKKKLLADGYESIVKVMTTRIVDKIEIKVEDNGNGIPQKIIDKIFQPFFTTKPTGQGTGLGLSLAYDIVKAHSGEIKVESKEQEGTTFIIQLPVNS